jgi:hypothetical protein
MKAPLGVLLLTFLSSCSALSLGPALRDDAVNYHQAVEDTANNILVTNILRARDRAPLHFSDLAIVRGSLQENASVQATFPFGPLHGTNARNSLQVGGVSLQNAPGFDLSTLDTQEFTKGILSPIDPLFIKYFLDQGTDPRVILLLFFAGLKTGDGLVLRNDPDELDQFFQYVRFVNAEHNGLYVNAYYELRSIGAPFSLNMHDSFKEVAGLDMTKVRIKKEPDGKYRLYTISPDQKAAFCRYLGQDPTGRARYKLLQISKGIARSGDEACSNAEVVVDPAETKKDELFIRSPAAIIEYLGSLLRLQQTIGRGITLDPGRQYALFELTEASEHPRFTIEYRGRWYSVDEASERDHTLAVLALVTQLLNSYKSAKDIPSTRSVVVTP